MSSQLQGHDSIVQFFPYETAGKPIVKRAKSSGKIEVQAAQIEHLLNKSIMIVKTYEIRLAIHHIS